MITNYFIFTHQSIPINKTSILIAGDSHIKNSLNPQFFDDAQNISQSGEPYIITYWKLKNIFKTYTPDTLILGFAPHNISQFNDVKFSNQKWAGEMFRRTYPIQELNKISKIINVDYKLYYEILWKNTAFYPKQNHINYIGKYTNQNTSDLSDYKKAIKRHYYQDGIKFGVSNIAVNYLDSIVDLTKSRKTKLVIISSPVHEQYLKNIPRPIMQKHIELMNMYQLNYVVFDKTTSYYPDSLYRNPDHLNSNGAKRFTKELIEYLK